MYCERTNPERKVPHDGPSGNRYYFNDSASAVADQWLDIDGVSYPFDATGALIEYKASGKVRAVSDAAASWRPGSAPARSTSHIRARPHNSARNSHVNLSVFEMGALVFQRFPNT